VKRQRTEHVKKVFSLFSVFDLISFLVKWLLLGHLSWISWLHYGRVQILGLSSQSVAKPRGAQGTHRPLI